MSQHRVSSEDYRKAFISTIFFAIILTEGLVKFVDKFIINIEGNPGPLLQMSGSTTHLALDPLLFAVTFFWIISHWIFYHDLITKYPYYRWRKFLVDIALFSIMFVALRLSLSV
ncbi:MAG: hypothetical protein M3270_02605, partial [Thermoproteota archaeon]|nr:hypothetical protein [Thermoproteota archaeon]